MSGWSLAAGVVVALLGGGWGVAAAALPTPVDGGDRGASRLDTAGAYGRLPLAFEANRGQSDRRVRFLARTAGSTVFLTGRGAVLSLAGSGRPGRGPGVALRFAGAHPRALRASRRLPGTVNYLVGPDRARWHVGIPTYGRVAYRAVWRGIDAAFYGRRGRLEYDFDVAPDADPGRIAVQVGGARAMHVTSAGALVLGLAGGTVRQLAPRAYQEIGGVRRPVAARYVLHGGRVHVRVGRYDHERPLVIDPVLVYSSYLGGSGNDQGQGIAVDDRGAAYITGSTNSPDFPTQNPAQGAFGGGTANDAFVTKLSPDGHGFEYSTYLGGGGDDSGQAIAVDSHGAAYLTGFAAAGFPTGNAAQATYGGSGAEAFVAKLSPQGQSLEYSTYLAGTESGNGVAVDGQGAAYVTGDENAAGSSPDAFVTKLSPDGATVSYSMSLGGSGTDTGEAIAVGSQGAAYVTGGTASSDFPTRNAEQASYGGGSELGGQFSGDAFVAKVNPAGTALDYSTYVGGGEDDTGHGIAVDPQGAAYITGETHSSDFPTRNAFQGDLSGSGADAFVTKLSPDGKSLEYSTYLGGTGRHAAASGAAIALDARGDAYITGDVKGGGFPTEHAVQPGPGSGADDAFATELRADGQSLEYSTYLGGSRADRGAGIAVDAQGAAYVTGTTRSRDYPVLDGAQAGWAGGDHLDDAFVTKLTLIP